MPRKKRGGTRPSRTMGLVAGTSVGTHPSGVTLTEAGLGYDGTTSISPTEVGYLDGAGGNVVGSTAAGFMVSGGSRSYAGASIGIQTGLTSVIAFFASAGIVSGASAVACEWVHSVAAGTGGGVTAILWANGINGVAQAESSGVSLTWIAFGT